MIYLGLGQLLEIASHVLKLDPVTVARLSDLGLAQAALLRPQTSRDGQDIHPHLLDKAAALMCGLARSQPFLTGNKEIALMATLQFLNLNGEDLDLEGYEEVLEIMLAVAVGDLDVVKLSDWMRPRVQRYQP